MKRVNNVIIVFSLLLVIVTGCKSNNTTSQDVYDQSGSKELLVERQKSEDDSKADSNEQANKKSEMTSLILATTTSTQDSGLLDYLLPDFMEKYHVDVKVVAVGTGKALQMGEDGEADVLLVHAKASEIEFIEKGYGKARYDVMYNDFVLVGPESDSANIKQTAPNNITLAFKTIGLEDAIFISRGDDSGTHKKELSLWEETQIDVETLKNYISAGRGMGEVLTMASEMEAYTISDRATYLKMSEKLDLILIAENDPKMFNQYGVIPVNPNTNDFINEKDANLFIEWILSEETQKKIGEYGIEIFGTPLFVPNANQ